MNIKKKITEQPSHFDHLEKMSVGELLQHINEEDHHVAEAVSEAIAQIMPFVETRPFTIAGAIARGEQVV